MNLYLNRRRFQSVPEDELDAYESLLYTINMMPGSGEYIVPVIVKPPLWAKHPWEDRLDNLQTPMIFMYGDTDYMWVSAAENVLKKNPGRYPE